MFQPKRTKYRKQQKGRNTGNAFRGSTISFGTYALKATSRGSLTVCTAAEAVEADKDLVV